MRSGIWTILYVMALFAVSLELFGTVGFIVATFVLAFWAIVIGVRSCALVVACTFILFRNISAV